MAPAPVVDRIPHFDERSRAFGVTDGLGAVRRTKRIWSLPGNFPLDQGREGACVGFGWTAELASTPVMIQGSNASALRGAASTARRSSSRAGPGCAPTCSPSTPSTPASGISGTATSRPDPRPLSPSE